MTERTTSPKTSSRARRGPRRRDWGELAAKLKDHPAAVDLAGRYRAALEPALAACGGAPGEAARGLTESLEALAADAAGASGGLWAGHGGEALARLLAGLIGESDGLPETSARGFADQIGRAHV